MAPAGLDPERRQRDSRLKRHSSTPWVDSMRKVMRSISTVHKVIRLSRVWRFLAGVMSESAP